MRRRCNISHVTIFGGRGEVEDEGGGRRGRWKTGELERRMKWGREGVWEQEKGKNVGGRWKGQRRRLEEEGWRNGEK